jgi:malonyl-CoA O-methyltransferase
MMHQEILSSNGIFLRCVGDVTQPPLVLLHGWAMTGAVFEPILNALAQRYFVIVPDLPNHGRSKVSVIEPDFDEVISQLEEAIAPLLNQSARLVGWSLGGNIATHWAAHMPDRFHGLMTVASNPQFVADDAQSLGMEPATFAVFQKGIERQTQKTLGRFALLQVQGATEAKAELTSVKAAISPADAQERQQGLSTMLDLLKQSTWGLLGSLSQPTVHLLGEGDALVPSALVKPLKALGHKVELISGAGHLPFLDTPEVFLNALDGLDNPHQHKGGSAIEKARVAASFGKASSTYDSVAGLQREIGHQLLEWLPNHAAPNRICDLGSGTGYFTELIADQISSASCIGLDLSEGMLNHAKAHRHKSNITWLCGDAESLPLAEASVDLLFTILAIQWCESIEKVMAEIARVLAPGSTALIATLGPDTLKELKAAWSEVDGYTHVNRFVDHKRHLAAIESAGLVIKQEAIIPKVLKFESVSALTHELKALGAHNMNAEQGQGLTGRARIKRFKAAYEALRDRDGQIPATYEVYYWALQKPNYTPDSN